MKAIVGGKIWHGGSLKEAHLLVDGGKILSVGGEIPSEAEVLDAAGRILYPGFIDAHSHIGVDEEIIGKAGDDTNEGSSPLSPQIRAIDGVNIYDGQFKEALAGGVTTVATGPGSANVFGGTFVAIKTHGSYIDEMVVKEPVAMKAALGENPKRVYGKQRKYPMTRMSIAALFREAIEETRAYELRKNAGTGIYHQQWESLLPVAGRHLPVKIHAHRADDIATAIRLAEELHLRYTIEHATEAALLLDLLKEKGVSLCIGPTFGVKSKEELRNKTFRTAALLEERGIPFAIITDCPVLPQGSLTLQAKHYVQAGLSPRGATEAITSAPAKILGIDHRVGALEAGKDADVVCMAAELFTAPYEEVLWTMVNGQVVYQREKN
ncbi:MAG: amidohydrolase [Tissierellia bacterium]|nr:amidohydrolase [Tissierellia bacterium]